MSDSTSQVTCQRKNFLCLDALQVLSVFAQLLLLLLWLNSNSQNFSSPCNFLETDLKLLLFLSHPRMAELEPVKPSEVDLGIKSWHAVYPQQ